MALHVGVYSPWDPADPHAWSGVVAPMTEALRELFEISVLAPVRQRDAPGERFRTRLRGVRGRRSLPRHTMATARLRSAALGTQLRDRSGPRLDALVAIGASTDVLSLPQGLPLIQVTDATFPAIRNFYPLATGLGRRNEREGQRVETASAEVTDRYLVASDWAAESLARDVGVPPRRVRVAPFGPGTPPAEAPQPRHPGAPLRVLAVIADWERKRGEDIVAAVGRARQSRAVHLTVVGRAPGGLPEWVDTLGIVDREALAEAYQNHDLLVDLATANAAGVVITDALTAGLPVVATRVGGVASIVREGRSGWLVDPQDAVRATARLLASLTEETLTGASAAAISDARDRLNWRAWASAAAETVQSAVSERVATAPPASEGPRGVMITPVLPSRLAQEAAGEKLVREVVDAVSPHLDLTLVTAPGPANERAVSRGGVPRHVMVKPTRHILTPALNRLGLGPVLGPRDLPAVRDLFAAADVVDLQWEENGVLLPVVRHLNRRARTVVTLHDVLSQRFERQRDMQPRPIRKSVWQVRRLAALALERMILRRADHVVVLSQKDADLLPSHPRRARVHVVPPAIAGDLRPERPNLTAQAEPRMLFVGFMARWANEEGMHWFVTEVLPRIRETLPGAQMAVAGGGLRDHVVAELKEADVDVLGFVDDLDALYREADVVVVPLLSGAGVKFKVVEALVRGVPVVTTSVGNEGITPADAAHVADSPDAFAMAVVDVLQDPAVAERRARAAVPAVSEEFGVEGFRARLKEIYS
ncbi:glycosyltransferase [Micrococcus endophyticus]|uniref:glycosyltransferase n=1 Tax=Micrococcus endophyticus TaxID=455343 RepID=UPI0034CF8853